MLALFRLSRPLSMPSFASSPGAPRSLAPDFLGNACRAMPIGGYSGAAHPGQGDRNSVRHRDRRQLCYLASAACAPLDHRRSTQRCLAGRIAEIAGMEFVGETENGMLPAGGHLYLVPHDTIDIGTARSWKVRCQHDLFGGVVPLPFVATKAITHGRVDASAAAPEGWSDAFAREVREVVLPGHVAFDAASLARAAAQMLRTGPVRLKTASGSGGRGQYSARDADALLGYLAHLERSAAWVDGVVVEPELRDSRTYSVGQVRLGGLRMSYAGRQYDTALPNGERAYAGSELHCVRGGPEALLDATLPPALHRAVALARYFHHAAHRHYPGLLVSRANYDVIQGVDARGNFHAGVLEQSWRIGGASGAEIEAVRLFLEEPRRRSVDVRTVERFGDAVAPPDAWVTFRRPDAVDAPTLKYVQVMDHAPDW